MPEELEKFARDLKGKPVTDALGKRIGTIISAEVVKDGVEYETLMVQPAS